MARAIDATIYLHKTIERGQTQQRLYRSRFSVEIRAFLLLISGYQSAGDWWEMFFLSKQVEKHFFFTWLFAGLHRLLAVGQYFAVL